MNNTTINKNQQLANVENLNSHNHNNRGVKAFSKIVKICLVYTSFVFIASKICLNLNVATKKLCQDFSLPKWVDILLCFIVVIFSALTPIGLTYFIFDLYTNNFKVLY